MLGIESINFISIGVSGVIGWMFGDLIYHQLWGKRFNELVTEDKNGSKEWEKAMVGKHGMIIVYDFLCFIVESFFLAYILARIGVTPGPWEEALQAGFWCVIGFFVPWKVSEYLWMNRPGQLDLLVFARVFPTVLLQAVLFSFYPGMVVSAHSHLH